MSSFSAGIDFSTGTLSFAVMDDNADTVVNSGLKMNGRDSSKMLPWLKQELENNKLKFSDIENWTCGMGPGSFTGLRILAALISGLTFNTKAKVRGIPSALAIAGKALEKFPDAKKTGVLYDGRRGEVLCYTLRRSGSEFLIPENPEFPVITKEDHSELEDFDLLTSMSTEKDALKKVLQDSSFQNVVFFDSFPVDNLISNNSFPWDRDSLLHPVYLRPPIHVKPGKIRKYV